MNYDFEFALNPTGTLIIIFNLVNFGVILLVEKEKYSLKTSSTDELVILKMRSSFVYWSHLTFFADTSFRSLSSFRHPSCQVVSARIFQLPQTKAEQRPKTIRLHLRDAPGQPK